MLAITRTGIQLRLTASVAPVLALVVLLTLSMGAGELWADDGPAAASDPPLSTEDPAGDTDTSSTEGSEAPDEPTHQGGVFFDALMVVGSEQALEDIPGSAHFITREELERQDYFDLHRILRHVPGINIQEEEGWGLRPNIGMRGTGSERSSKITLMEDGVLAAPAPYAAPSAYYVPNAGRMESLEVRKGSSSIRQGPYTTGGVLNMISTSIPADFGGKVSLAGGEDGTVRGHAVVGDSRSRYGWLLETYQFATDGFKDIDGGGDAGTELEDYLFKFRFNSAPGADRYQAFELKLGSTDQEAHETYLGLTEDDFRADPFRRYAASQQDLLETEHEQIQLTHFLQISPRLDVTSTAYNNDFFRNWDKLQSVNGVGLSNVLSNPQDFATELAILRGEVDSDEGALKLRNNRRDYYSRGVQTVLGWRPGNRHDLEFGVRYHEDEEDRFQEEDSFRMVNGQMEFDFLGAPGSQSNRESQAEALAFFIQDEIDLGRWTLTPGVRFESVDFTRRDYGKNDPLRSGDDLRISENSVDEWIPGFGVDYSVSANSSVFGGVHKGFSPPGPGRNQQTDPEESVNWEAGYRYRSGAVRFEAVAFYNDYDNLLGQDTLSSGGTGTGDLFNGGEVEVEGLELTTGRTFSRFGFTFPVDFTYTYTAAEFRTGFESEFDPWGTVSVGDELPYLPEHQASATVGVVDDRWSSHLSVAFVDEMRTEAGTGPLAADQGTDSHVVLDLSADYVLRSRVKIFLQVRNLTDEIYVAARRPAGARPGLPRTVLAGFDWSF